MKRSAEARSKGPFMGLIVGGVSAFCAGVPATLSQPATVQPGVAAGTASVGDTKVQGKTMSAEAKAQQLDLQMLREAEMSAALGEVMDITAQGASLQDIVDQINAKAVRGKPIEVREPMDVSLNFSLPKARVSEVLGSAASLAGCHLYVLPSKILLAPPQSLSREEKRQGARQFGGSSFTEQQQAAKISQRFVSVLSNAVTTPEGVLFSQLDPRQQRMAQYLVDEQSSNTGHTTTVLYPEVRVYGSNGKVFVGPARHDGQPTASNALMIQLESRQKTHVFSYIK